ncbi:MAG TPA: hypothetical protein VN442_23910 [Bryobacteraceae bacterium]|nr:hypothetical protein [Bryobacteraceae bacterium]
MRTDNLDDSLPGTLLPHVNGRTKLPQPALEGGGLFRSFWIGGFEASCHINTKRKRLDMTAAVGHDVYAAEDYALLRGMGILTARDGIRWHLMDRGGQYDFSAWAPMLEAARAQGVQVIWDICHYGWPDDLDIFSPAFIERYARFCRAVTQYHRETGPEAPFFAPINEISFFAWAASRRIIYPFARGRDGELKRQLIRAAIAGAEAIRDVDPRARFVYPEPLIHTVPPLRSDLTQPARDKYESQFEVFEMLLGRAAPELGGDPKYLDIIGLNYYAANQWVVPSGRKLRWDGRPLDKRWRPLHLLLAEVWRRYQRPMFIAETSHYGVGRAAWIAEVAGEVFEACNNGIPVEGICLYPILDRFDWNDPTHWHNSGLWDFEPGRNGHYRRVLNEEYAAAVRSWQEKLAAIGCR